jgi:flagellar biosynthesis/type III secretory pathway M-ring protein FliF/YscJ
MKDLFSSILGALRGVNGPTRVVIGAAIVLALAVAGFATFQAHNPSFTLLYSELDESQLSAVQSAIAKGGIRFQVSSPPGPYSLWVEDGKRYEALSQVATQSALQTDPRGIQSGSGMESVWMSAGEREQMMQKRRWQEVELQLETYPWIGKARLTSSTPEHGPFSRTPKDATTVSVVLQLVGISELDRERSDTVAQIVSFAFGIPRENVIVSDQNGRQLLAGSSANGMNELLQQQEEFDRSSTSRVQDALDRAYGPGLTVASVHGEWSYDELESVEEKIDPTSKTPVSEFSHDTETPQGDLSAGGPVGTTSNLDGAGNTPTRAPESPATTSESSKEFAVSRNTSHLRKTSPVLSLLAVNLVLDKSLEADRAQIEQAVKGLSGFVETRDGFSSTVAAFPAISRDDQGKPVAPTAEAPSVTTSPMLGVLLERAVEIVAALAFVLVLMKSLKRSGKPIVQVDDKRPSLSDLIPEEEIDLDMLARAHVDELLKSDPEKVSKLLSRWALGEKLYSRSER